MRGPEYLTENIDELKLAFIGYKVFEPIMCEAIESGLVNKETPKESDRGRENKSEMHEDEESGSCGV